MTRPRSSAWLYEHRGAPLAPRGIFLRRVAKHFLLFAVGVIAALLIGIFGYRITEGMAWIDAFLNAAMILGGMGPVGELHTTAGKIFAGIYAIFAGVIFLVMVGVVLAPVAHRVLHRLHLESGKEG